MEVAAGLAELMGGGDGASWLGRSAEEYRASWRDGSWGRPIAARIYPRGRPLYHPLVTGELDKLKLVGM